MIQEIHCKKEDFFVHKSVPDGSRNVLNKLTVAQSVPHDPDELYVPYDAIFHVDPDFCKYPESNH